MGRGRGRGRGEGEGGVEGEREGKWDGGDNHRMQGREMLLLVAVC